MKKRKSVELLHTSCRQAFEVNWCDRKNTYNNETDVDPKASKKVEITLINCDKVSL